MPVCKLCHENEADKKGSHLVPHFLMKRIDNVDGKPGRDLELGFQLGSGQAKGYFGRAVQPEKLEKVFGELSDKEIANARSNLIVDHLLCSHCEKRLSEIEAEYAETLKTTGASSYKSTGDPLMATLFWLSIFWRVSVSGSMGFKLNEIDEHHLRIVLDGGLDAKDAKTYVQKLGKEVTSIVYKVLRSKDFTEIHDGFLFFHPRYENPYCAMIGEFAVFFSIGKPVQLKEGETFFGLEKLLDGAETNNCENGEFILPVKHDIYNEAVKEVIQLYVEDFTEDLIRKLDGLHRHFIGHGAMDLEIKKMIIAEISEDFGPLGRKYTPEAITEAVTKVLMKFEPYKSIGQRFGS